MTRLRRFHQDDAHIFCRPEQIEHESRDVLDFIFKVRIHQPTRFPTHQVPAGVSCTWFHRLWSAPQHKVCLECLVVLLTDLRWDNRPDSFCGKLEEWAEAEAHLEAALKATGRPWTINPGDGAFYGPKIDCTVKDALGADRLLCFLLFC
jgi:threonyl-tRNA synthetase